MPPKTPPPPPRLVKVLDLLIERGPSRTVDVAAATGLNRQTVSRTLAELRRHGHADSERAPQQRRGVGAGHVVYTVTDKGREYAETQKGTK